LTGKNFQKLIIGRGKVYDDFIIQMNEFPEVSKEQFTNVFPGI
jgi:hypothetical protein